jgi:hypothetical protein
VKRTFSEIGRFSAGLLGRQAHEAEGQDFADLAKVAEITITIMVHWHMLAEASDCGQVPIAAERSDALTKLPVRARRGLDPTSHSTR